MELFKYSFEAMASPCSIQIYGTNEIVATLAAEAARDEVLRIERKYSRYRDDSELSRINLAAASGGEALVDSETAGLLNFAFEAFEKSGGLFDISSGILRKAWNFSANYLPEQSSIDSLLERVGLNQVHWSDPLICFTRPGMELDFGGIGKEYAADRARDVLVDSGVDSALVDLGGDLVALGPQSDGSGWRIGIQHPRKPGEFLTTVALLEGALASSGDYERFIDVDGQRYCHILDPRTGWPCHGLASVTVVADKCLVSGCIATIAMLKGDQGAEYLSRTGLRHLHVDVSGVTSGNLVSK